MAIEPQRDLEQDLLAYKRRRHEQLGAPLELHPATRKMLQGEVARTANRPLLTSEEAAKNFVRSFAMSNQRPGFFARYKHRIIWGGAMFASLAIVLAVLRNDPQQKARQQAFQDILPAPPALPVSPPPKPQNPVVANQPKPEVERLSRDGQVAPKSAASPELAKASAAPMPTPVAAPAATALRGIVASSGPMPAAQREVERRSSAFVPVEPTGSTTRSSGAAPGTALPPADRAFVMAERPVQQLVNQDQDSDAKATAKKVTGEKLQLAKTLKAAPEPSGTFVPNQLKADEAVKLKVTSELKRAPDNSALGLASTIAPAPTAAPMPVTAAAPQAKFLGDTNAAAPVSQSLRFQQLDQRAGYRQNFNSPPPLQVMQDFAFERTGDRVRIVDADGSTYQGTVTSAPTDGLSEQAPSQAKDASARKDVSGQKGQSLDPQGAYHFYARGVNRRLNQAVEFRGEWQPASPAQGGAPMPALLPASFGATRFAGQTADKLEKAGLTSTLNSNGAPDQAFNYKQAQQETSQGRISGRAVVGGKDEFGIIAVPK